MVSNTCTRRLAAKLPGPLIGAAALGLATFALYLPAQAAAAAGCDGGAFAISGPLNRTSQ